MDVSRIPDAVARHVLRAFPEVRPGASFPEIGDLGLLSDRHSAALVSRDGAILWFAPGRFDAPSLFAGLLDPAIGGAWRVELPGSEPLARRYLDRSAVLETTLSHPNGRMTLTDWMNLPADGVPRTLCRMFTAAPAPMRLVVTPRPNYGAHLPQLRRGTPRRVVIEERFHLQGSHPITIRGGALIMHVPQGERSWAVLADTANAVVPVAVSDLERWLAATRDRWSKLAQLCAYDGPWPEAVHASVRTLHMLVYEPSGAIAAAASTGLPEIVGGGRNYDYRYAWLRDSGMIVRALLRFEPDAETVCRHLGFFASLRGAGYRPFLDPVWSVGGERVPPATKLRLSGYRASRPVLVGNPAAKQLQLGSLANFLLGMKEIYERARPGFHWDAVAETVEFLISAWRRTDHGIWEESQARNYTASKVFSVCAIEGLARFTPEAGQRERWLGAAQAMRAEIERAYRTPTGAYADRRGATGVDISAALFAVWGYCAPTAPAMEATIRELDRRNARPDGLYHRNLVKSSAQRREGAFLAGTFWVAHYWVTRGELERARALIEAGLSHANDLGLFSEEVDSRSGRLLGNLPLGLVHGSVLAAIADYREALERRPIAARGVAPIAPFA